MILFKNCYMLAWKAIFGKTTMLRLATWAIKFPIYPLGRNLMKGNIMNKGAKEYNKGMKAAKRDRDNCGESYVLSQIRYGLQGKTDTFYKGYRDYYNRYCPKPCAN